MGGLGNQLFQYSAALTLSKLRNNDEIVCDTDFYKYSRNRKFELYKFKLPNIRRAIDKDKNKLEYKFAKQIVQKYQASSIDKRGIYRKLPSKSVEFISGVCGIYIHCRHIEDLPIPSRVLKKKNIYLFGYFLRPRFISNFMVELKARRPGFELWKKNYADGEHVCVHIRLDDYVQNELFELCTPQYYYEAMKYIAKKIINPIFHIFSDDLDSVRKAFKFAFPVIYEEENDASVCLMKMSLCKHFVLSNSTFSWWAQRLAQNENKIVVAPMQWYPDKNSPFHLYCDDWKRIKT